MGESDVYRMKEEPAPRRRRRRYTPPTAFDDHPEEYDEPPRHSWMSGFDPFFIILGVAAVLWLGLGLATGIWAWMGLILALVGLLVCLLSKLYLTLLIFQEDPQAGMLSLWSSWYKLFYLHQNIELTVRPMIVGIVGLMMIATGVLLFIARAEKETRKKPVAMLVIRP